MNRTITTSGSPQSSAPRPRLAWLDLLRGAAVLAMIETHVVNTFLAADLRAAPWFAALDYLNGLVAPSFLFIAGYVAGLERRASPAKAVDYPRRARRLLGLVALGYALHFPLGQLVGHHWAEAWWVGTHVDVLQCLAAGLGVLVGLSWIAGKRRLLWLGLVIVCAVFVVTAAPWVQQWVSGPVPLRAWVNATTGSLFPLLPWVGFVLVGALAGTYSSSSARTLFLIVPALLTISWSIRGEVFSAVSPSFFLERAAWVLALAAITEVVARRVAPPLVVFAGQNSLALYVIHLVLISALTALGVKADGLSWPVTLAMIVGVAAISLVLSVGYLRLTQFTARARVAMRPALASESA